MTNRRRSEPPSTTALRPVELSALLQAASAAEGEHDPERPTVEMLPLDDGDDPEPRTTEIVPLTNPKAPFRPTVPLRALAPPPPQVVARGSAPMRAPRVTRRSVEMLRADDIKPPSKGGRRRKPTR